MNAQGGCGIQNSLAAMKRRPHFSLTRAQVIARCRECNHQLICAGQVLALMDMMRVMGWTMLEVAARSGVSHSMIADVLRMRAFFTTDKLSRVVGAFGLEMHEFDRLAMYEVGCEVPV